MSRGDPYQLNKVKPYQTEQLRANSQLISSDKLNNKSNKRKMPKPNIYCPNLGLVSYDDGQEEEDPIPGQENKGHYCAKPLYDTNDHMISSNSKKYRDL